jgi:hypothetical protein
MRPFSLKLKVPPVQGPPPPPPPPQKFCDVAKLVINPQEDLA